MDNVTQIQTYQAIVRVLNDERSHLRNLCNKSPGFIAVLMGPQHVFEIVNEAYYQLVGHRDLLGKPVFEALPDVVGQGFEAILEGVYQSGEPWVGQGVPAKLQPKKDGPAIDRYIDLLCQPFRGSDGKVNGIFVQGHDVTEIFEARAAEHRTEKRWKLALKGPGGGAWDWNCATGELVVSKT